MRRRVIDEQDAILEALALIEAVARLPERPDLRPLGQARRRLVGRLLPHFTAMRTTIYPALLAGATPDQCAQLLGEQERGRVLAEAYRAHIARWHADSMLEDWEHYRLAALDLILRIRRHFAERAWVIDPLLDAVPRERDAA